MSFAAIFRTVAPECKIGGRAAAAIAGALERGRAGAGQIIGRSHRVRMAAWPLHMAFATVVWRCDSILGAARVWECFMAKTGIDRRGMLISGSAAAAGLTLAAGGAATAAAQVAGPVLAAKPFAPQPMPLPFDVKTVPFLSEKLLTSHHDNNYVGAVQRVRPCVQARNWPPQSNAILAARRAGGRNLQLWARRWAAARAGCC